METLKTATGKEFPCDYFNLFAPSQRLNIQVHGISFVQAANVFSNPEETKQLWYTREYVAQFTKVVSMSPVGNSVRIVLTKE